MNRDALLATIIGFGVGLLLAGGVLFGPKLIAQIPNIKLPAFTSSTEKTLQKQSDSQSLSQSSEHTLTIESPLADAISDTATLIVSGSSNPESIVIVAGLVDEDTVQVGSDGKYTGKVTLLEGKNDLLITSILSGKSLSQVVVVYYSSVKL